MNNALWESRITPKESIWQSPYLLVYGKELMLPANLEINALSMACQVKDLDQFALVQSRYLELMQLEEQREKEVVAIENR